MDGLEWFDINKYDNTKNWDREDWRINLFFRGMYWKERFNCDKSNIDQILQAFQRSLFQPLLKKTYPNPVDADGLVENIPLVDFVNLYFSLYLKDRSFLDDMHNACKELYDRLDSSDDPDKEAVDIWQEPWDFHEKIKNDSDVLLSDSKLLGNKADEVVTVALYWTDEQLIRGFKDWLKQKRKDIADTEGAKKRFNENDFKEWHALRVMAYIDLKIWSKITENDLTNNQIGQLVFPDEFDVDVTERVRKVIAPKAMNLLGEGIRRLL